MEIGATKAVQDRLKTTKIAESKGVSLVFCWDTHLTKIKGRNVLFIVNASNRYTIAMTDIENYSVWMDIKILFLTFKILFQKENTEGVDQNQTTAIK